MEKCETGIPVLLENWQLLVGISSLKCEILTT